jgi:hypothetical protein
VVTDQGAFFFSQSVWTVLFQKLEFEFEACGILIKYRSGVKDALGLYFVLLHKTIMWLACPCHTRLTLTLN